MGKPLRKHWTFADWLQFPESNSTRYEVLDGELAVTASPASAHQLVLLELARLIQDWAEAGPGGVTVPGVDLHLADDVIVCPDLLWASPERESLIVGEIRGTGMPDLVVEILSPSTKRRDRTKKAEIYARFGGREYWLVDPTKRAVELFALEGDRLISHSAGTGADPLVSSLDPALVVVPDRVFRTLRR